MPTVLHRLARWAQESPDTPAQGFKQAGEWLTISAREYCDRVYHLALFLESRGVTPQDVGAIYSYNCPQWVHLELAMVLLGGKTAGIYPNSTPRDINYILNHTEARVVSVQNQEYFQKMLGKGEYPLPERTELLIVFDGNTSLSPKAIAYQSALDEGRRIAESGRARSLEDYLSKVDARAGAFMIYTSGTTGNPKGALVSHDNLAYTSDCVAAYWKLPRQGSLFSFLPLCHIAEQLQNVGVGITMRYLVQYATKFENVSRELPEASPTLLLSVPRLWEKMMEGVMSKVEKSEGAKKKLAQWAFRVGERVANTQAEGRVVGAFDLVQFRLADKLVFSKVREALGLGRCETLASGAAALPAHVSKWFATLGLEILEDFGQTETTGVVCMTEPGVPSYGTVGRPVPGLEFKLAEDGEILTRGRHVFVGYFKDDAATAATFGADGWLHTGDLGELDERGRVKIRGRKKEVLKTSGGKMIAPLPIEEKLKESMLISQVCLVGDNRKYLSALVTLAEAPLADLKAKEGATDGRVVKDAATIRAVRDLVDSLNRKLANYEQIKKVTVLAAEFSIDAGEMTPTLKMKRNVIESRYKDLIDQMYS